MKLGNLFLNERMEVKVGDYGLAAKVVFEGEKKRTICGTPNYIAPEVLSSRIGHSYEVDLWSLGVITYTMIFGRPPFETRDVKITYRKIKSNNFTFPHHVQVSEESKDFIKALLKTNPQKRLGLNEIMKHGFFTNYPCVLPPSTLSCPPSSSFMAKFITPSEIAPKPECPTSQAPNAKDIATFECDLIENDDAQIMSRQTSVQSHRRMESQDRLIKFNRPKETLSNERDYMLKTDRGHFNKNFKLEQSPQWSPAKHANYLQINLAKYDDKEENKEPDIWKEKLHYKTVQNSPLNNNKYEWREEEIPLKVALEKKKSKGSSINIEKASKLGPRAWDKILISKWIDYSSKYGLGYRLSNGIYGVLFNDSTKIVISKDEFQFYYLKRDINSKNIEQSKIPVYDFNNYPQDLKKKVILAQHFVSYLLGEKFTPSQPESEIYDNDFCYQPYHVFLKKYSRENKAILFRLNNKIIQVIFLDKSELISGSDSGKVCFITSKGDIKKTTISNDMNSISSLENSDPSLYKRLNYAKGMLINLINPKRKTRNKLKESQKTKKLLKSETKENKHKFSRKNSAASERGIEFYATQALTKRSPDNKENGKCFILNIYQILARG